MKTYNNLFEEICSFQNLHLAYLKARKCKRYRNEILKFSYNLEANLTNLQKELSNQTYQHGSYREFIVCDLKKRHIKTAPFRDRVVHHAVCNIIEPIFNKGFIFDSYACLEKKGTHKAIKRLEIFLKSVSVSAKRTLDERKIYCLQCDISKYFNSIDHQILFNLLKKKIADKKTLWLIKKILDSSYDKKLGVGIPIGNLTSQLFANIYLNELDQFIKHKLHLRYYLRYMDDFLILGFGKKKLHGTKVQIREFLKNQLRLKLHPKKANIFPANKGINFLGYWSFGNYRLLRKTTIKRFIKRMKKYQKMLNKKVLSKGKFNNSLQSWTTYAHFANSYKLIKTLSNELKVNLIK